MTTKITREVLESHLNCKFKGYLKQSGQQAIKSDYEVLLLHARDEVRLRAIERIVAHHQEDDVDRNVPLTAAGLKRGALFVLDATLEDDVVSLHFDGLMRVDSPSKLGAFHYVPILFYEGRQIRKEQRLLLDLYGLLLSRIQGKAPASGIVWHGSDCRTTKIRLSPDPRRSERLLRDLQRLQGNELPRLVLNGHCQICEFRQQCRQQAIQEDNLSLLRGMGEKELLSYARKGILTLTQLAHTFRPRRKGKRTVRQSHHRYHALQALAIRDKRIYVYGTPELPSKPVMIYLDIEGVPDDGLVYLIGMVIVQGGSEQRLSFWADNKDQERDIFERCLAEFTRHEDFVVFCYGGYERAFLKRMRKGAKNEQDVDRVLDRLVNVLSVVYSHVYFPCHSNGLKDVAGCLGHSWTNAEASGVQSIAWKMRWESSHENEWKQKLLTYNLEDCAALKRVTELISTFGNQKDSAAGPTTNETGVPQIVHVQEIDKLANNRKWGRVNFVHTDYEFINNRAYFDYQRERVYVRTSKLIRKSKVRGRTSRNRKIRVTHHVKITALTCPRCTSSELIIVPKKERVVGRYLRIKRAFDLVFGSGGIKRRVIKCTVSEQRCVHCGHSFVPEEYRRLDKHFHGLKSWAMYQHVAHRLSLGTVESMIEEFFGLRVSRCEVHMFKSLMARHYQPTYHALLRRILSGNVLHIDETEIKLHGGKKGYVWVFTNLEEVVFMYRRTREEDFLKRLLKDFRGVLVSDFYSAYDGIPCPQQKCLIHLMRDMNQDLLNSPYDEELRSITRPFGTLLRAIVATVDEHGLKRRHLMRHKGDVTSFFDHLSGQSFSSEVAEALRERLLKHKDCLFTFIEHDGVPWNNNNAENAVKQFAYYREGVTGNMKETGLRDYLVLLSICLTCR